MAYKDLANKTEQEPTAPDTVAYEKGRSVRQYALISFPPADTIASPCLHMF